MNAPPPPRWLESSDAPLSPAERESLASLARRGPSAEQLARVWQRVESAPAAPLPQRVPALRWTLGGVATLLLCAGAWLALSTRSTSVTQREERRPTPSIAAAPAPEAPASPSASTAEPPALAPVAPSSEPSSPPAVVRKQSATAPLQTKDPGAELALLTPARQVLAARPERTLALADEHARRFPHGAFAEERSFLRIQALQRLGRHEAADAAIRAFRRQYPSSGYLQQLEAGSRR